MTTTPHIAHPHITMDQQTVVTSKGQLTKLVRSARRDLTAGTTNVRILVISVDGHFMATVQDEFVQSGLVGGPILEHAVVRVDMTDDEICAEVARACRWAGETERDHWARMPA